MKYIVCLAMSLFFVFSVAPAMAADLQPFAKMTDQELSSVRGGANNWNVMMIFGGSQYDATGTGNFFASRTRVSNWGRSVKKSTTPGIWVPWYSSP